MTNITAEHLRSYIQRIENLEVTKSEVATDIKEVYAEAKGNGYDAKIIKLIVKQRATPKHQLDEQEYMLEAYKSKLGMLPQDDEGE